MKDNEQFNIKIESNLIQLPLLIKREYFAIMITNALLSKEYLDDIQCAKRAIERADELIRQLENKY